MADNSACDSRQWYIVSRWQAFAGETRANLLRIGVIATFYLVELVNYQSGNVAESFHRSVTAVAAGYVLFSAAVLLILRRRMFPAWLPFLSSAVVWSFGLSVAGIVLDSVVYRLVGLGLPPELPWRDRSGDQA